MTDGFLWMTRAMSAAALMMTVVSGGCGGGSAEPASGEPASGGEPALVIADAAEWQALTASGQASYDRTCGTCHPGGDADLGPAIKGRMRTSADMTKQIREGSGRMAPIDTTKLPEEEMKGMMVYLSTISAVSDVKGP